MSKFPNNKEITRKTNITAFNTIFRPVLTYVLTRRMKSKVRQNERSDDERQNKKYKYTDLETKSLREYIEDKWLSWQEMMMRMKENVPVKKIWVTRMKKRRKHRNTKNRLP